MPKLSILNAACIPANMKPWMADIQNKNSGGHNMDIESRCPAIEQELATLDAYWRAANYLSACQLYLLDDPLLQKPPGQYATHL